MKRPRGVNCDVPHKCPYSGCAKRFRSARLLARHASVHAAAQPLLCTYRECHRTFAFASERDAHVRKAHLVSKPKKKEGEHVLDGGDDCQVDEVARESSTAVTIDDSPQDSQLEEEADEIVTNGIYLASQMKVARSYAIAEWQDCDYTNAHQWARWIEESVEDFPDMPYLERKIKEKGLSLTALRNAERAFFDSVLAYEGFNKDILNYLMTAALTIDGKEREADDVEARMECLSSAVTSAVEQKNNLRIAVDLAEHLHTAISEDVGDETVAAKAEVLLSRHKMWDTDRVRDHINRLDLANPGVFELICHEAILAHDEGVNFRAVLFEACRRGIGHDCSFAAGPELMGEGCERDVAFFDVYFSTLLRRLEWKRESKQTAPGKYETIADAKYRIKSLADRKGPIGYITRCAVKDFAARTGMRDLISWKSLRATTKG